MCIWSSVLVVTGPTLQPGLMLKGIQHAAIQTVMCVHRLDERMRETGNVLPTPPLDRGRPRTRRTPILEEMVLDMVAQNPCHSTRGISRELGVEHSVVNLILQAEDLYPYHCSRIQNLMPHDYHHRLQYCEWLLRGQERDPGLLEHILWSDEAAFTREGVFNSHNSHFWAQHNPHVTPERNCLQGSADWHGRLDSKVSCRCGDHWYRHVTKCAS
jgi:hypothetical protein